MPSLLQFLPGAVSQGHAQVLYAEVTTPLPTTFADPLYVVLPDWSIAFPFAITNWQTRGTALPTNGVAALLVVDSRGLTRCVWWDGLTTFAPQADWTPVSYQNSWTTVTSCTPAAYLRDPSGWVHLRGRITAGASGTVAFTLPTGYRPDDANTTFAAAGWNGSTPGAALLNLVAGSPGQAFVYYASGFTDVGLGGISFLAAN